MAGVENSFNKKEIKDNLNSLPNGVITAPFVNGNAEILRANTTILTTYTLQALDLSRIIRIPSSVTTDFDITIPQSFTGPSARRFIIINESDAVVRLVVDGTLTLNYATDPFVLTKNTLFDIYRVSSLNYVVVNSGGATLQSATIASASALNIGSNTFINVTGTTTINSISSISEGTIVRLKFESALTLTASSNIILPLTNDVLTATNDVAEFVSQGSGVYRLLSYTKADESYTNYTPTFTGLSTPPPIATGLARYKMLSPNVCQVIISPSTTGTSNATTKTITLPFPASSTSVQYIACVGRDNNVDTGMAIRTRVGSNIADVFKVFIGAHTASGNWSVCVSGTYEID